MKSSSSWSTIAVWLLCSAQFGFEGMNCVDKMLREWPSCTTTTVELEWMDEGVDKEITIYRHLSFQSPCCSSFVRTQSHPSPRRPTAPQGSRRGS